MIRLDFENPNSLTYAQKLLQFCLPQAICIFSQR